MKTLLALVLSLTFVAAGNLHAQADSPSSSATAAGDLPPNAMAAVAREEAIGTITDITPGRSMVLHTGTNAGEPVVFRFAEEVTYVDSDGKIIEAAGLRKNLRVRVSFVKIEGSNVIDKVTILQ